MRIDPSRLLHLLGDGEGFVLGWREDDEFALVRPSRIDGLFEQIVISVGGKAGQAVACDVAVSVVRGQLGTKGMCELETLAELATDSERGVATIETAEQAQEWEAVVAKVAPAAVRAFAQREGPKVLARTSESRSAVARYLALLGPGRPLDEMESWLTSQASPEEIGKANQLAGTPGILWKSGATSAHRVATLAIVVLADRVEGNRPELFKLDPLPNHELVWRVHLLVDSLTIRQSVPSSVSTR